MSDENFLDEVAAAAGGAVTPTDFTSVVKTDTAPPPAAPPSHAELVDSLVGEKKPKRETLSPVKKAAPEGEAAETVEKEKTATPDDKAAGDKKDAAPQKKGVPYMDRYYPEDAKGNLLLSDGSILAAAGNARAAVEGLKKEARDQRQAAQQQALANIELGKKFKGLYDEFTTFQKSGGSSASLAKETGLASHEVTEAVKLMKLYKTEPLAAIKSLLTQAHANGIDISSLGVKSSLDIPTLVRMLKETPQEAAQETAPSSDQALEHAREVVKDFVKRNPTAAEHIETIAAAKRQFPEASLDEIWIHFRQWQSDQAARTDEEEVKKAMAARKNTMDVKNPPQKQQAQQPDYSRMSFAEIAEHLKGELNAKAQ